MSKKKNRNNGKPRPGPNSKRPPDTIMVDGHPMIEYSVRFDAKHETVQIPHPRVFINLVRESAKKLKVQVLPIEWKLEQEARSRPLIVLPGGAAAPSVLVGPEGGVLA